MVEALEVMAASVEALPGGDIGGMAGSAEIMPGGNYETIDMYTDGAESMYCTWCIPHQHETRRILDQGKTDFFPTSTGLGISYKNLLPKGDIHDTFKVDRYDNLYSGHSTLQLPKDKHKKLTDF